MFGSFSIEIVDIKMVLSQQRQRLVSELAAVHLDSLDILGRAPSFTGQFTRHWIITRGMQDRDADFPVREHIRVPHVVRERELWRIHGIRLRKCQLGPEVGALIHRIWCSKDSYVPCEEVVARWLDQEARDWSTRKLGQFRGQDSRCGRHCGNLTSVWSD